MNQRALALVPAKAQSNEAPRTPTPAESTVTPSAPADESPPPSPAATEPTPTPVPRPIVLTTDEELSRAIERSEDPDSPFHASWRSVRRQADAALDRRFQPQEPDDVATFYEVANPQARAVHALAVAYRVSGNEAHLRKARRALMAWARHSNADLPKGDPSPSWHDHHYPGKAMPDAAGLHISRIVVIFADAYAMLQPHLPVREQKEIERWFASLRSPIQRSSRLWEMRKAHSVAPNQTRATAAMWMGRQDYSNHLTAHAVGLLAIGYATGNERLVEHALRGENNPRHLRKLFSGVLLMPGDQLHHRDPSLGTGGRRWPEPLPGTIYDRYRVLGHNGVGDKGIIYASLGQRFLTLATEMAANNGARNYWWFHGRNGENLRDSYHTYAPYITEPERVTECRGRYHEGSATSVKLMWRWRAMTEMAFREYPFDPAIRAVIRTAETRDYNDSETLGGAAPLLKGEELDPQGGPTYRSRAPRSGAGLDGSAPAAEGADAHFLGDWDGDGVDTPGWRIGHVFWLSNEPTGAEPTAHELGRACDEPLVGDWNGDGRDSIGVRRGKVFHLAAKPGQRASISYSAGQSGDRVVIGDWDGDGVDTPALVRGDTVFLRTTNAARPAWTRFHFGRVSDRFVGGDWDGDGVDTLAAVRVKGDRLTWHLRADNGARSKVTTTVRHGHRQDAVMAGRPDGERSDRLVVVRYRD